MTRIAILGVGYVGLVTGACFAEKGHDCVCIDIDPNKVDAINRGESPIHEPGLDALLQRNIGKRLKATLDAASAIRSSEMTMIAVGTPFDGSHIDLSYVTESARTIGKVLRDMDDYHVVVVKSTVVPGTTDQVVRPLLEEASGKRAGQDFGLGMNPEFLTEGEAISDFMDPDRVVCGGIDARTQQALIEIYEPFPGGERISTGNATAEMIKYASNALLATLISFSNEFANLSEALGGIDAAEVMHGLHKSRYLTPLLEGKEVTAPITSFLMGGCGFGGSCLPKDVSALVAHGRSVGSSMNLLQAVLDINKAQHGRVFELLGKHFPSLEGKRIAVLGLAFRPDTNDMRESPAIPIVQRLLAEGASVVAYDPAAADEAQKVFGERVTIAPTLDAALTNIDAGVLVTRWKEFERVPQLLRGTDTLIVDGRRLLDKRSLAKYEGIGLGQART